MSPEQKSAMKVLHVINALSAGGAELHLLTLCRYLKRQGAQLVVGCLKEYVRGSRLLRPDFEKENIRIINLQVDSRYDWRVLGRLARLLKEEQPDILHTHLPRADIGAALIHGLTRSPVFLCSVHGIYQHRSFGYWAGPLMRYAYRKADALIAISSAVKNWLDVDFRITPNKIRTIHYGIELERFTPSTAHGGETDKQKGQVIIGSIGRLEAGKGFDCLIHVMSSICKELPHASLLIAGADTWEYGKELKSLINQLGLQERVHLVGFQHNVASFLHRLDVFAFASRSEGFGQVVIEAMAVGKPVVAGRIPPLTEIVVDGETGLLVEPDSPKAFANAIVWLLAHPEEARHMGKRGQERVHSHFSAKRMSDETLSLYNELMRSAHYGLARFPGIKSA
jgi:glycosyltransferase involved in cell wall biosynthesis